MTICQKLPENCYSETTETFRIVTENRFSCKILPEKKVYMAVYGNQMSILEKSSRKVISSQDFGKNQKLLI